MKTASIWVLSEAQGTIVPISLRRKKNNFSDGDVGY